MFVELESLLRNLFDPIAVEVQRLETDEFFKALNTGSEFEVIESHRLKVCYLLWTKVCKKRKTYVGSM